MKLQQLYSARLSQETIEGLISPIAKGAGTLVGKMELIPFAR